MKKLLLPFLAGFILAACKKEISPDVVFEENAGNAVKANINNIDVCHLEGNGSYHTISINENALPAHLSHGDILPDADGDGYTKNNPCSIGSMDDCDDNNDEINPAAMEVCGDALDNNCNGQIDEVCNTDCANNWMLQNLDVTTYRNGDNIPQAKTDAEWLAAGTAGTGTWCYYNNDPANGAIYGKLYNWYAVNDPRGLAPEGWHVPTDAEWTVLTDCLGGSSIAGGQMKSTGTVEANTGLWLSPNINATNISGFTGLPGSFRKFNGLFHISGRDGVWWSSSENEYYSTLTWVRGLAFNKGSLDRDSYDKRLGFSVRCLRD